MKARKSDIIWNYIGTLISLGANFFLLPFMIYFLDGEELGLWYVFLSIGAIVTLFDFGFNPTLARNVTYCWSGAIKLNKIDVSIVNNHEPNIGLLKKLIFTCKKIYLIISVLAVFVLITIGTIYILKVSSNMSGYNYIVAWGIYILAVFLNLYYGYYTVFLRGVGAIAQSNKATIISRIFQIIISIILLFLEFHLSAVSLAYLGYGLIYRFLSKKAFYEFENIGSRIKNDPTIVKASDIKETFNIVWHNAWRDGVVSISRYLTSQASVIISSIYFSLTTTGIYSISVQLITAISTISGALYTTYQPSLQAAYINNRKDDLKKLMSIAMTVYCVLFWVCIIVLLVIGIPILKLLNPNMLFSIPILLGIAVYDFLLKHHSFYASFISNTNRVPYMKPFLISSFVGIIFSILLIKTTTIGIWGLIVGQFIAQIAYNNWIWPYKVMKLLNTNPIEMFRIGIKKLL
ncbi:O-unit flippase-like protein [Cohnella laeviribosi]|jgi:O-antigen/teichoic acid export membrane protein|uniref:O-unit flippase-like protein n=1 Tax=Cohnella laeviribosi TaxID=380174 RepID=UPI0003A7625E|nr:O-unit flippase-like protein [Cohnella laeviribosi]